MITEADYRLALAEIRMLVEAEPDRRSPEGQRLDMLAALAESYEAGEAVAFPAECENR